MLDRLLDKLLSRRSRSAAPPARPASPPRSTVASPPPPPPPPAPPPPPPPAPPRVDAAVATRARAPGDAAMPSLDPTPVASANEAAARMQLTMRDGARATPALDPELKERLEYIVDNIVRPSEDPST